MSLFKVPYRPFPQVLSSPTKTSSKPSASTLSLARSRRTSPSAPLAGVSLAEWMTLPQTHDLNMNPGASSLCVFHRTDVDGSGVVHGVDFVIVTCRWRAKKVEKHLRRKCDLEVETFGPGDSDGKAGSIFLDRILTWRASGNRVRGGPKTCSN